MEWTPDGQVILEHMNRLQNTNTVFLANAESGALRQMFQDKNDTWVEVNRNFHWIEGGKRLLFTSERDGWRHLYAVSRDGDARLVTSAPYDMVSVAAVDESRRLGLLHRIARDRHPALSLSRAARWQQDGASYSHQRTRHAHLQHLARLPLGVSHRLDIRFSRRVGSRSAFPITRRCASLNDNAALKAKIAPLLAGRTEMVHIPVGHDTTIDGWLIRPTQVRRLEEVSDYRQRLRRAGLFDSQR